MHYKLDLAYRQDNGFSALGGLEILREELPHIKKGEALAALPFRHKKAWRDAVISNKRTVPFISMEGADENRKIKLHQDGKQGGSPVRRNATTLPRTVLSSTNAAENPTALLARNEMRSWRLLQLEPSSLRKPDEFNAPAKIGADGAHLAATLYHLAQAEAWRAGAVSPEQIASARVYGQVSRRLAGLLEDVYAVGVDRDEKRELLTLQVTTKDGAPYPARALSDGTLRFLALAVMELDPATQGVLCLEEPENGIHPARIPAMLELLQQIAVDTNEPPGLDNPLRQVIVNTHSPAVVGQVPDDSLLMAEIRNGKVRFSCLPDTWRHEKTGMPAVSKGALLAYLNPIERLTPTLPERPHVSSLRRVVDRADLEPYLWPDMTLNTA